MPVKLRRAAREDAPRILEMQRRAFAATYERFHDDATNPACEDEARILRRMDMPGSMYFVILYAGREAGAVRVAREGGCARISPLFVLPEYQRRGLGMRALAYLRALMPEVGLWTLDTIAQLPGNCAFYEGMGFKRDGRVERIQPGMDAVGYELRVARPVSEALADYLRRNMLTRYAAFDEGHDAFHALNVMDAALGMAAERGVSADIACAAAACHDIGLACGRERHHLDSGRMVREDAGLRAFFSPEEIESIARACEDHRASGGRPRELLGCMLADADRELEPRRLIYRTLTYGRAHFPELSAPEQRERVIEHVRVKYGPEGYMQPWLGSAGMEAHRRALWAMLEEPESIRALCREYEAALDMR